MRVRRVPVVLAAVSVIFAAGVLFGACQAPGTVLQGTLTTTDGTHLAGVQVAAYSITAQVVVAQTTTDADGHYQLLESALPDGTYKIRFATNTWWNGATSWNSATLITASAATPAVVNATVNVTTGSVAGSVTNATSPISGATVDAINTASGYTIATEATSAAGTYSFDSLPAGNYVFKFAKAGFTTRYNNSAATQNTAQVVPVTGGATITGVDASLAGESTITGTVTDGTNPAPGIVVGAFDPTTGQSISTTFTASDGTFTIGGLTNNPYTVAFGDFTGHLRTLVYGSTSTDPSTGTPVTPVDGTISVGTITLSAPTTPVVPTAPSEVIALPMSGIANTYWTAPDNDGGAPITGYTVTASTGQTCTTTGDLFCLVSGLTNGTPVSFTVTASNASGTSAQSAPSAAITPGPAPFCSTSHANADLAGANLGGANLGGCDFTGANLTGANLTGSSFLGTNFTGANLTGANLTNTTYPFVNLTNANLTNANVSGADLNGGGLGPILTGVTSGGLTGTPRGLETGWQIIDGYLVGPGANLTGANLANFDLAGVNFSKVNLTNANLTGANLTGANFGSTTLSGADLAGATLTDVRSLSITGTPAALPAGWSIASDRLVGPGANLSGAFLAFANLSFADLSGANLVGANLDSAILSGANLSGANLTGANLGSTNFANANLTDANLTGSIIKYTNFTGTTLTGVTSGDIDATLPIHPADWYIVGGYLVGPGFNLVGANLTGANLNGLNLSGTNLAFANLTGVDLTNVNLTGTDLSHATLTGVVSANLTGTPLALPAGWSIVGGQLVHT